MDYAMLVNLCGGCNSTCLELVITMMLVSLIKPAWNIAPIIAKRYFV
jgi:hypothetical protein